LLSVPTLNTLPPRSRVPVCRLLRKRHEPSNHAGCWLPSGFQNRVIATSQNRTSFLRHAQKLQRSPPLRTLHLTYPTMSRFPLPKDLPAPIDDGACDHLPSTQVASVSISATDGSSIDLSALSGLTIVFCYPRTGAPGENVPPEWDAIPGARGCSPQACSFNDSAQKLYSAGVKQLFGLSTQDTEYQQEAKERLGLA
jgi:hypothetical protein